MPVNGNEDKTKNQSKYDFIEEQIVPKRKSKVKKLVYSVGTTIVLAVIFGIVSRAVFCISGSCLDNILGEDKDKKKITFTTPSPEPNVTPKVQASDDPEPTKDDVQIIENVVEANLNDYAKMYSLLSNIAKEFNKSVVTVSSVISGIDWFDNPSERLDAGYGVVIANNGEELLVMTSKGKIEDANSLRVTFSDNTTIDATLNGYDTDTGIAIIAIPINDIPEETLKTIEVAVLGDTYYLPAGTPIMALGSPNGYVYSMELGFTTGSMVETYITDSKLELFHTDLTDNPNGEGVIVNLSGQVIGIITHDFSKGLNDNINTNIGITKLKSTIEKLVNRSERVYFGIIGNDIPKHYLDTHDIDNGIYVTKVITDSPAFKAGIKSGDIIINVEESSITSMSIFNSSISNYLPKQVVDVKLLRTIQGTNQEMLIKVTLAKKS